MPPIPKEARVKTPLEAVLSLIEAARTPRDLFRLNPKEEYRKLAKICHPDVVDARYRIRATKAFAKLTGLYDSINPVVAEEAKAVVIEDWTVSGPPIQGDVCSVYPANGGDIYLKIPNSEDDNDLMDREEAALLSLHASIKEAKYLKYFPTIHSKHLMIGGKRINAIGAINEGVTLDRMESLYDLSDPRHLVWIMNRLLTAIWVAHSHEIVHSHIIPSHLLYLPEDHGLILLDWCGSCGNGQKPAYKSKAYSSFYPKEVDRGFTCAETDIYMAAMCLLSLKTKPPKAFIPILDYCLAGSPASRPHDASKLQRLWKEVAEREFGKPEFVELKPVIN